MVKVLEPGRDQQGFAVEAVCTGHGNGGGGCGAKLLVETQDMRYYPGVPGDSWGSRDPCVVLKCVCGVCTDLPRDKWPPNAGKLPQYSHAWRDNEPEPSGGYRD